MMSSKKARSCIFFVEDARNKGNIKLRFFEMAQDTNINQTPDSVPAVVVKGTLIKIEVLDKSNNVLATVKPEITDEELKAIGQQ